MNNREIKFRIWDRQQRKFHTDADWGISLRGNHIIGFSSHDSWNDDRGYKINLSNQDNLIVQQYTGLKDKNGIPIYEGDILLRTSTGYKYTVEYRDDWAGYVLIDTDTNPRPLSDYPEKHLEVIGNIFENPELITNNE